MDKLAKGPGMVEYLVDCCISLKNVTELLDCGYSQIKEPIHLSSEPIGGLVDIILWSVLH